MISPAVTAWHMGALHAYKQVLVLVLAFGPFVVLGIAVLRRGGRARAMLLIVSLLFFLLADGALDGGMPNTRWFAALLLAGAGAAVMTARLRSSGAVALR